MDPKTGASLTLKLACWGPSDHPGCPGKIESRFITGCLYPKNSGFKQPNLFSKTLLKSLYSETLASPTASYSDAPLAIATGGVGGFPMMGSHWSALGPVCSAPGPTRVPLGPNLSHSYPACLSPSHSECLYLQTSTPVSSENQSSVFENVQTCRCLCIKAS